MKTSRWVLAAALAGSLALPGPALARALSVNVSTDRGDEGVYQPGERIQIKVKATDDAHLMVYEIDAQGYVHVLFPYEGGSDWIEAGQSMRLPQDESSAELVVQGPVGEGYVVAVASSDRFKGLPWYLRPYDSKGDEMGYYGRPSDQSEEEGVTAEGQIAGDPFVAMERIRRRVLDHPEDEDSFATAYVTYYVHHEVRYPRYLCNDCHRPNMWAWWDGFDPYYARCSAFDFRINWGWGWGPSYWFGNVPYYVYVYRQDCPPRFRDGLYGRPLYSSWDGWGRWRSLWHGSLTRYKSPPPPGYVPPSKSDEGRRWKDPKSLPPGFLAVAHRFERPGGTGLVQNPAGRPPDTRQWRWGGNGPAQRVRTLDPPQGEPATRGPRSIEPPTSRGGAQGSSQPEADPAPRVERPRSEQPPRPREEPRFDRRRDQDQPRFQWPGGRRERDSSPPKVEQPRQGPPPRGGSWSAPPRERKADPPGDSRSEPQRPSRRRDR